MSNSSTVSQELAPVAPQTQQGTTDPRTFTFYNTSTQKLDTIEVTERTWGELKNRLRQEFDMDMSGMMVSYMSDKSSLVSEDAILKSTNEVIYISPQEQKGGMKSKDLVALSNAQRKAFMKAVIKEDAGMKDVFKVGKKTYSKLTHTEILNVLKANTRKFSKFEHLLPKSEAVAIVAKPKTKKGKRSSTPKPTSPYDAYVDTNNTIAGIADNLSSIADIVDNSGAALNAGFIKEMNEMLNKVGGALVGYIKAETEAALGEDAKRERQAAHQKALIQTYKEEARKVVNSYPTGLKIKMSANRKARW